MVNHQQVVLITMVLTVTIVIDFIGLQRVYWALDLCQALLHSEDTGGQNAAAMESVWKGEEDIKQTSVSAELCEAGRGAGCQTKSSVNRPEVVPGSETERQAGISEWDEVWGGWLTALSKIQKWDWVCHVLENP